MIYNKHERQDRAGAPAHVPPYPFLLLESLIAPRLVMLLSFMAMRSNIIVFMCVCFFDCIISFVIGRRWSIISAARFVYGILIA